ncbi:MAG: phenylalanine--tRNA ligase subunit beta [Candidatus Levybacteria bacterium]|nr:phenylalanine--tRNA ligase subunit beta [Candidatus Levybacteria bacterium]
MNIKIVDSWLREFLDTKTSVKDIATELSLTSVSVEKIEKVENDDIYDIEVTTNRPDLMSVIGIAREASAVLKNSRFNDLKIKSFPKSFNKFPIEIVNDPKLVNRICAVILEIEIGDSPKEISQRLEKSGIRSLNNLIDVTNYVMREVGHPTHVFDFDRLNTKKIIIRQAKKGEVISTLDGKTHVLLGGDIVADDGTGKIIDLLGVMGTANSVVTQNTKKIMFFIDNNNPVNIRNTSMSLGIRSEAAILNEKGVDPELSLKALLRGIELYEKIAKGKVISEILDIYPNKPKEKKIKVDHEKIKKVIGVELETKTSVEILNKLGFNAKASGSILEITVPPIRADVSIDEDIIEEVARIYGYHNLPSVVPTFLSNKVVGFADNFYFEKKAKNAFKYFGFTEVYTYSLISEELFDGPIDDAIKLKNPLSEDMAYLRNSLIPSLLNVVRDNKGLDELRVFELSNIYLKKQNDLPNEVQMLSGIYKKPHASFYEVKGFIEQVLLDLGIKNVDFKKSQKGGLGASIFIEKDYLGEIEVLDTNLVDFELNFETILKHASNKKTFKPFAKFPPIVEDISVISDSSTQDLINTIKNQDALITEVTLKDTYKDTRTFHIVYLDFEKNLTNQEVSKIREKVISVLKEKFKATIKE